MIVAAYILAALVGVGAILYAHHRLTAGDTSVASDAPADPQPQQECCGMHATCERDSLLTAIDDKPEYFDDYELDNYAGRGADDYTDAETEQFRDVLLTLQPAEVATWARSIAARGIQLPAAVREEMIMLLAEQRIAAANTAKA